MRLEEMIEDPNVEESDNRMQYHVTVVHNPNTNDKWNTQDIDEARVFDLTASSSWWGEEFSTFTDALFLDEELLTINTGLIGFVMDIDHLTLMNERLCAGVNTPVEDLRYLSDALIYIRG